MNWPMMTIGHDQKNAGPAWLEADAEVAVRPGRDADEAERDREVRQEPERPSQLRLDPQRSQVGVVALRLILDRFRHDLLLLPPRLPARD